MKGTLKHSMQALISLDFYEQELRPLLSTYLSKKDVFEIDRSFEYAKGLHQGQFRKSGEPYIIHPLHVAKILAEHKADRSIIIAAMLHDSIEDTKADEKAITQNFGEDVASLVIQVTKLQNFHFSSEEEGQSENLRKLLLAMASDTRVVLIKIADRLHNMRTLDALSPDKQIKIAKETMEILVPLVHRLGMYAFKWELEDLSFKYLEKERYREIKNMVATTRDVREAYVKQVMDELYKELINNGLKFKLEGRPKNLFSINKKMVKENKNIDEIYDLFATRVLVQSVNECYSVLGIIHNYWRPVPGRIKDYIATPKSNGYRSLHTTVFGPNDELIEIQIRTFQMHQNNEVGIASHWSYKERSEDQNKDFDEKVAWLRQIFDWQSEIGNAKDFVSSVKFDLFNDEIFVFSPKGKVVDLPSGATPVDFAYRIHSDIGNSCIGAKVNGRIVTLDSTLQTGDRVQILTSKIPKGPTQDWLKFVRSPSTRAKIRAWFRKQNLEIDEYPIKEKKEEIEKESLEKKELQKRPIRKANASSDPKYYIDIEGNLNLPIIFPRCCNPVPSDEVVGYISRGRGIVIHRIDCHHVKTLSKEPDRIVKASWTSIENISFVAGLYIKVKDEPGTLAQISSAISSEDINLVDLRASISKTESARIIAKVQVKNIQQLNQLIMKLTQMACVEKVRRM
jgi:GTP diphosphokinase / guanosine-3',5'-bis(diphosphate) 3'-diphosphatase